MLILEMSEKMALARCEECGKPKGAREGKKVVLTFESQTLRRHAQLQQSCGV